MAVSTKKLFSQSSLPDLLVSSIEYDSRKVEKGSCFVALRGFSVDGHDYINSAMEKGASLFVVEDDSSIKDKAEAVVKVDDSRSELARLSDLFYDHPSAKLGVVGVTGTNGKTTIAHIVKRLFEDAGYQTSCFGTIDYQFPDETLPAPNTTPESADLQKMFSKAAGYESPRAVMEVSSHGLALGRLLFTDFKGGVFTNLTQDHLDFHSSMKEYGDVKKKLFTDYDLEYSVINIDDPVGAGLVEENLSSKKVISYGFSDKADIKVLNSDTGWGGTLLQLSTPAGELKINSPMPGKHNIYNVMAVVGVGIAESIELGQIAKSIESVKTVPGRFERVDAGQEFAVVVDYAHTDNALSNVLKTARELTKKRVICLFGCGGDRDSAKRKLMGQAADKFSDIVVVTSDNPRTENPKIIIDGILEGIKGRSSENLLVVESREEAIAKAIKLAQEGDCLLIAGKGHEDYQIIGKDKIHFDDKEIALKYLTERN